MEKHERLLKEVALAQKKANESDKFESNFIFLSPQLLPIRSHLVKHASQVKKFSLTSVVNSPQTVNDSTKLYKNNEYENFHPEHSFYSFNKNSNRK